MAEIFLRLLNVSITATWVVLAVLILRLCLKKAPQWITCLLWAVVGLRLILPFSFESVLSLVPSTQTVPPDIALSPNPAINSGIDAVDKVVNPVISEALAPQGLTSVNPLQIVFLILALAWLVGIGVMLLYGIISSVQLYRSVRPSVCYRDNVYVCDEIDSPFVLGIIRPRIYLPSGMDPEQIEAVIAHEQSHLKRKDHWWKPLGYALLTVYWFNPVLWLAYILLCRDIEMACDEKVIKTMDAGAKKAYSQVLVDCSCNRRTIMACPLAFGEVGVKARIKAVLHYKKPAIWIIAGAVMVCVVLAVCFLTDPLPCEHIYARTLTQPATCAAAGMEAFTCKNCSHSYTQPVAMLSHTYKQNTVLTEPSCTQTGSGKFVCTVCGDTKTEELEMTGHVPGVLTVIKAPTCAQEGESSGICAVCNVEVVFPVDKTTDHAFENTVVRAATCVDPGEGINTCRLCGYRENCRYSLAAHSYGAAETVTQATCTREGQKKYACTVCGETKTEAVATVAHSWGGGSCTQTAACTVCGMEDPRGPMHQYTVTKDAKPTLLCMGIRTYTCNYCGGEYKEPYGASGVYDMQALEETLTEYAAGLGFRTIFSDNQNRDPDYGITVNVLSAETFDGQAYLEKKGKELIDKAYAQHANAGDHTLWVVAEYFYDLWEGDFRIRIYMG